jgi:hypothetical protein
VQKYERELTATLCTLMVEPIEVDWECDPDSILSELCNRDLNNTPLHILKEWRDLTIQERLEVVDYYHGLPDDVRHDITHTARMFDLRSGYDGVSAKSHWPFYIGKAAEHGDINLVRDILQLCPNSVDNIGTRDDVQWRWSPLMRASDLRVCTLLLDAGAKIEWCDEVEGATPLVMACLQGSVEKVRLLLERGANIGFNSLTLGTPLDTAIGQARTEIVELLIEAGADIEHADENGLTPLMAACSYEGRGTIVALLLRGGPRGGANVHRAETGWGRTALHLAASCGDCETAEMLLEKATANRCCNPHAPSVGGLVGAMSFGNETPMSCAKTVEMRQLLSRWDNWERRRNVLISLYGFGLWRLKDYDREVVSTNYSNPRIALHVLRVLGDANLGRLIVEYV